MQYTAVGKQNPLIHKIFKMRFLYIAYLTIPAYILSKNLAEKLLPSTFCDQTLYITNVCRVISHVTKVALHNNFLTECVLFAHRRIDSDDFHVPAILMESI